LLWETAAASDATREATKVMKNNIGLSGCQRWSCTAWGHTDFKRIETSNFVWQEVAY